MIISDKAGKFITIVIELLKDRYHLYLLGVSISGITIYHVVRNYGQ